MSEHLDSLLSRTKDTLLLDVRCSKGTYIRTLAQDIGDALGFGAYITSLDRTEVSPFDCSKMYTIEELEAMVQQQPDESTLDSTLLSLDTAISNYPQIILDSEETTRVRNGLKVARRDIPNSPLIRLYHESGEFIGIGRLSSDMMLAPKRMMRTN